MNTGTKLLSWETHEFEPRQRHPDWLWTAGLVAGLGAAIAFFYGDFFFGIFLVLAGIVVILYAVRPPQHLHIEIYENCISINEYAIDYKNVRQFWLDETDKDDKLLLLVSKSFMPFFALPLRGVSAAEVRKVLTGKAPEVEMHESASVKIFDRLGF